MSGKPPGRFSRWGQRRQAPARRVEIALVPREARALADAALVAHHFRHIRDGASGTAVYEIGSPFGGWILGPSRIGWLAPSIDRHAVHGWAVLTASLSPRGTWLTLATACADSDVGRHVEAATEGLLAQAGRQGVLLDPGEPLSTYDLGDTPALPARFRRLRGD
jgi:hypothetical protein